MIPITRIDWEGRVALLADKAFAEHVLFDTQRKTRWYVHRPNTGIYCFEVVSLIHSRILVHGDIHPVLFEPGTTMEAREAVRWLAVSDLGYISEKVITGQRYAWEAEVALMELEVYMSDANERMIVDLMGLRDQLIDGSVSDEHSFRSRIYDITGDVEFHFGRVVDSDIIYAKQALVALNRLLTRGGTLPAGAP